MLEELFLNEERTNIVEHTQQFENFINSLVELFFLDFKYTTFCI